MHQRPFPKVAFRWLLFLSAALLLSPAPGWGMDTFFVGPRAMGMAGANVASVNDTSAQYYNPAAFGFFGERSSDNKPLASDNNDLGRKRWGVDLNASGGYRLQGDFGQYLDDLSQIDYKVLANTNLASESDLVKLIDLVKDLNGLNQPGNAITADANAGLAVRVGHFAVGARGFAQASGQVVSLDETNLGLPVSGATLNTQIGTINVTGNDGQVLLFTAQQQADLTAAGLDSSTIQKLDYLARQEGVTSSDVQGVTSLLSIVASGGGGTLDQNTTTVRVEGFGLGEVPLSYGYPINEHWAVGGNIKLLVGRVYGTELLVFDNNSGDVIKNADNNYKQSVNFGLDLGVMGRYKYFNVGLVGRNLNAPSFDGPTVTTTLADGTTRTTTFADVTIDPQVTAGVAFIPFDTLTIESDCDLTQNATTLPGYDTQNLSFGVEWTPFHAVALRAGTYKNLLKSDIGWVYTAGLGVNLWAARLDVAGAFSTKKGQYDGNDVPEETRLSAQLSVDF